MGRNVSRIALIVATVSLVVAPMMSANARDSGGVLQRDRWRLCCRAHHGSEPADGVGNQVAANGGTVSPSMTLNQPTYTNGSNISGVINTAADGTTTSVGTNAIHRRCVANSGRSIDQPRDGYVHDLRDQPQGGAPRPTTLESNAACSNAAGFAYAEVGGAGENTTRDAVEFTFSRPVLAFGAWFGDLETRTDGNGVAAVVRLYGPVTSCCRTNRCNRVPTTCPRATATTPTPDAATTPRAGSGFVADPAQPVVRMVVIVGDEDAGGSALDEGMGFIGPTLDLSTATISLSKSADPLTDTNAQWRDRSGRHSPIQLRSNQQRLRCR